ncbi:hypothetical protein Thiowin_02079 [Thiorhodovibrio winogradskyi]|uniref:Uncharacterized protein n=1 Tax=Thiorhodovibrio winogradskyi TaxID=77007 RepID=A0ABZ0S7X1_9GAMM
MAHRGVGFDTRVPFSRSEQGYSRHDETARLHNANNPHMYCDSSGVTDWTRPGFRERE